MARRSAVANMRAWLREEESKPVDQLVAEARAYAAEQQRKRDERAAALAAANAVAKTLAYQEWKAQQEEEA
jgi:hypothetical protein